MSSNNATDYIDELADEFDSDLGSEQIGQQPSD